MIPEVFIFILSHPKPLPTFANTFGTFPASVKYFSNFRNFRKIED